MIKKLKKLADFVNCQGEKACGHLSVLALRYLSRALFASVATACLLRVERSVRELFTNN